MFSILVAMVISTIAISQVSSPKVKVEFITPKIVRVQWSADGALPGNNTSVCVYEKQQVKSPEIIVKNEGGCISFIDRKTGRVLLLPARLNQWCRNASYMTMPRHTWRRPPTER